jgi:hypothetical protein
MNNRLPFQSRISEYGSDKDELGKAEREPARQTKATLREIHRNQTIKDSKSDPERPRRDVPASRGRDSNDLHPGFILVGIDFGTT